MLLNNHINVNDIIEPTNENDVSLVSCTAVVTNCPTIVDVICTSKFEAQLLCYHLL